MRIISGKYKGQLIIVPKTTTLEPAKEVVRNAIFSMLDDKVVGATVLDLFAGTGSLGLEALSRGATSCHFVDQDEASTDAISTTLNRLNLLESAEVTRDDVLHFIKHDVIGKFDLIFLDPPYVTPTTHLLKLLSPLLPGGGIVVYLCGRDREIQPKYDDLALFTEKCYGLTKVAIFKKAYGTTT